MFHFQSIIWSETCYGKNVEEAENAKIWQLVSVVQRSVTHSRVARAAHQAATIKTGICCVRVCNVSILACLVWAIASIHKIL
jgi:hypothetical protein